MYSKKMVLDLHGCSTNEAVAKTLNKLLYFEQTNASFLEIITGIGTRTLFIEIENLLLDEGWEYEINAHASGFIVRK